MIPKDLARILPQLHALTRRTAFQLCPDIRRQSDRKGRSNRHDATVRHRTRCTSSRISTNPTLQLCDKRTQCAAVANTPTFTMRLPPELRAELERRANADERSLAHYVTRILAQHVASAPYPYTEDAPAIVREQNAAYRVTQPLRRHRPRKV